MRVMLEARLSKAGHVVDLAPDVSGVERALAASEFDVVITDLRMRTGGDGLDVLRKVKTAQAEVEIILMTAFGSDDVRRQALELGAYGYVEKSPTLASELIALVKAAVQKRELARRGRILRRTTSCSGSSSPRAAGSSRWWRAAGPCTRSSTWWRR